MSCGTSYENARKSLTFYRLCPLKITYHVQSLISKEDAAVEDPGIVAKLRTSFAVA